MTNLKTKSKVELLNFIGDRLSFEEYYESHFRHINVNTIKKLEHYRFEMSGYESKAGDCTIHNLNILNKFADLGIYDYTHYLILDFYKGAGTLYFKYWGQDENIEVCLGGLGTREIIYEILKRTILTNLQTRRRS